MDEVLKKYKERLINLSGKNRSLLCRNLPKKRGFDLVRLAPYKENLVQELLAVLMERPAIALSLQGKEIFIANVI